MYALLEDGMVIKEGDESYFAQTIYKADYWGKVEILENTSFNMKN